MQRKKLLYMQKNTTKVHKTSKNLQKFKVLKIYTKYIKKEDD